jgi:5-hydroxyisourate hydrolase
MAKGGRLTVHVLDVARGQPAGDLELTLFRIAGDRREALGSWRTNPDGRCGTPLLEGAAYVPGSYELVFAIGEWRARLDGEPGLYDEIPIRFRVRDAAAHLHVPLLLAPYGYSTYRGS